MSCRVQPCEQAGRATREWDVARSSIKRTWDGQENYFLTLFETTDEKAYKEVVKKYERIR